MKQISNCCKAEVKPNREDLQRGETYYNVCTKCGKPCDLYVENEIEKLSDEEFISEIRATGLYDGAEEELRKRLKKAEIWSYTNITPQQAVEEFKKKLVEEIEKNKTISKNLYECIELNILYNLIKNTK